jgi:periplasmic copper chaperone A
MTQFLKRTAAGALFAVIAFTAPAFAHEVKVGALEITNLWTRATPPKAPTGAGYMTITNKSSEADTLIAVSTPAAEKGELHIMEVKDGIMTMHPVEGGIKIPANGSVTLAPGGYHLMFINLKQPFENGGKLPVTLIFEKAGTVETFLHIMPVGSRGPTGASETMDMNGGQMNMDNGQMGQGK